MVIVSKGLAAPVAQDLSPTVQAASLDALPEAPPAAPIAAPSAHPAQKFAHHLMAPGALPRLVAFEAAHPRPMGADTACLARTVYREASNQTLQGQLAVAQVVLNRMKMAAYPKSACAVVGQPRQFATADQGGEDGASKPWDTAVAIASIAQRKQVAQVAPGALYFHATYVSPAWSQTHERVAQIGDHIFYR